MNTNQDNSNPAPTTSVATIEAETGSNPTLSVFPDLKSFGITKENLPKIALAVVGVIVAYYMINE